MSDIGYRDYGYSDAKQTWSHSYLWDAVVHFLPEPAHCSNGIVDLGCGNGAMALRLLGMGYEAIGVDASESGIAIANSQQPGRFSVVDFSQGALPPKLLERRFDVVLSTEVIEHLYDPKSMLRLAKAILQPDGMLIVTTPYHGYLKNLVLATAGKMDEHFTALWDGGHIKFFSRTTLTKLLEQEGFKVTAFQGAGRVPYLWKSMVLVAKLKNEA